MKSCLEEKLLQEAVFENNSGSLLITGTAFGKLSTNECYAG